MTPPLPQPLPCPAHSSLYPHSSDWTLQDRFSPHRTRPSPPCPFPLLPNSPSCLFPDSLSACLPHLGLTHFPHLCAAVGHVERWKECGDQAVEEPEPCGVLSDVSKKVTSGPCGCSSYNHRRAGGWIFIGGDNLGTLSNMCSAHGEMKERGRDLIRSDPAGGGGLEGQCPDSHCCPMGVWAHGPLEFRPGSLL